MHWRGGFRVPVFIEEVIIDQGYCFPFVDRFLGTSFLVDIVICRSPLVLAEGRREVCDQGTGCHVRRVFSCLKGLTTGSKSLLAIYDFSFT